MIITGIDPGCTGAIVNILPDHSLEWVRFKDTESFTKSCWQIRGFLQRLDPQETEIYIEKVHSRGGQGAKSIFTFGNVFGQIQGMLKQEGLFPFNLVTPQDWQETLGLTNITGKATFKNEAAKKSERKKLYLEHAKKLFPKYKDQITLDLADAILIAEYGYRIQMRKEYDV